MAGRLSNAGHDLVVWSRTRAHAEALADRAEVADSPAEAGSKADVAVTMLADGAALEEVVLGRDGAGRRPRVGKSPSSTCRQPGRLRPEGGQGAGGTGCRVRRRPRGGFGRPSLRGHAGHHGRWARRGRGAGGRCWRCSVTRSGPACRPGRGRAGGQADGEPGPRRGDGRGGRGVHARAGVRLSPDDALDVLEDASVATQTVRSKRDMFAAATTATRGSAGVDAQGPPAGRGRRPGRPGQPAWDRTGRRAVRRRQGAGALADQDYVAVAAYLGSMALLLEHTPSRELARGG